MRGREPAVVICVTLALTCAAAPSVARTGEAIAPTFGEIERARDAAETFRLNAVGIVSHEVSGGLPTLFVFGGSWWRATRGKFRHAISYDDFFRKKLGRPDLADEHARRRTVAASLFWGGVAAQVGGAVLFFTGIGDGFDTQARIGLALFVGGFATSAVGSSFQHPSISEREALDLAEDYNQRLRRHLGLSFTGQF